MAKPLNQKHTLCQKIFEKALDDLLLALQIALDEQKKEKNTDTPVEKKEEVIQLYRFLAPRII